MKKIGLGIKIMVFTFLIIIITAGVLIYFSYRNAFTDLERSVAERLEAIAATGALMLDGDLHDQVRGPGDESSDAFKQLQKVLRNIKKQNNLREEIYTFRREGNDLKFIVMTHEKPFIGDPYHIKPEMWPALNDGKTSHTGIYRDAHGIWISAYAPIFDSRGQISGILDVDIAWKTFQEKLMKKNQRLVLVSVIILVFAILAGFMLSRRLVRQLRYLSSVTKKISLGQMERSIEVSSNDEVGELSLSLERMRLSLKMAMDMIDEKDEE